VGVRAVPASASGKPISDDASHRRIVRTSFRAIAIDRPKEGEHRETAFILAGSCLPLRDCAERELVVDAARGYTFRAACSAVATAD